MVSALLSRVVILVFGTLYPAYKSYKAVKTKNVKEYVKWMMYWIVFALFTCVETFTDLFVAWLPFYYELKIVFVLWLLSPATKGASILYRKFVHPQLSKREQEIDAQIEKVTDQGYTAIVNLGQKGFQYATNVVLSTAIKGQAKIADQLKRSYSMSDVSEGRRPKRDEVQEYTDDEDETDNRLIAESFQQEMMQDEKDIDTQAPRQRRKTRQTKDELDDIEEDLDAIRSSKKYSHKEASHYGTLPRSRGRSAKTATTAKQRHSYHE